MPPRTRKRKSDAEKDPEVKLNSGVKLKKTRTSDENMKLYEEMKKEAVANKLRSAESSRKDKEARSAKSDRRITIAAPPSSSRSEKDSSQKPSRPPRKQTPAPSKSKHKSSSESSSDVLEEESSEEDPFDRLVQNAPRRRVSDQFVSNTNEYAKVYSWQSSQRQSRRQRDLQRQKELDIIRKQSTDESDTDDYSQSDDDTDSESIASKNEVEKVQTSIESHVTQSSTSSSSMNTTSDVKVQLDDIFYSCVSFLIGFMLVTMVYLTLTRFDANSFLTAAFGSNFTILSGEVQEIFKRMLLLISTLTITFCALEIFLLINRHANKSYPH